ncbi:MAG: hypothetical protein Q4B70_10320 [Lachnospiraceae bacterium]|nr:hypothetical protein [Lachnospiraceae bacterium]
MSKKIASLFLCLIFALLLLFPEAVQAGAKEGLYLWYNTIIPILFPFILISNLMLLTDSVRYFTYPFLPLVKHFPRLNAYYPYALVFGWFCGYPMGAKTVVDLLVSGKITVKEGNFLLPAVNQASPIFLMGYVGVHIFKKQYSFGQILFFVYFPVIIYFLGGLFLDSVQKKRTISNKGMIFNYKSTPQYNLDFEHVILSSFQIIVNIGVYMMIFTILMRLILLAASGQKLLLITTGFLEISTGIAWLNKLSTLSPILRDCLILFCASFGGLCTCAQTHSIIHDTGLSLSSYIVRKMMLGISTLIMAWYLL